VFPCPRDRPHDHSFGSGSFVAFSQWSWNRSSPSSVFGLSVSVPPKLRVTTAETDYMSIYLRIFFRALSSWVRNLMSEPVPS
jgi:hypothetical protein